MGARCGSDRPLQPNRKIWDPCPNISRQILARASQISLLVMMFVRYHSTSMPSLLPDFPSPERLRTHPWPFDTPCQAGAGGRLESTLSAPSQVWASIETKHARAKGRVDQESGLRVPGVQAGSQDGRYVLGRTPVRTTVHRSYVDIAGVRRENQYSFLPGARRARPSLYACHQMMRQATPQPTSRMRSKGHAGEALCKVHYCLSPLRGHDSLLSQAGLSHSIGAGPAPTVPTVSEKSSHTPPDPSRYSVEETDIIKYRAPRHHQHVSTPSYPPHPQPHLPHRSLQR